MDFISAYRMILTNSQHNWLGVNGQSEGMKALNCLQHLTAKPPTLTSWLSTLKLNENRELQLSAPTQI